MSQLSIKLSDKADALIAQLQKEIFNRRRKKVTAAGVVETLVESGARSQSDKRFATSWVNLIQDIEKAAKLANAHGSKPSALSDAEWAMVLSHRQRTTTAVKTSSKRQSKARTSTASAASAKAVSKKVSPKQATVAKSSSVKAGKAVSKTAKSTKTSSASVRQATRKSAAGTANAAGITKPRPAKRARKTTAGSGATSVAKRMAKAAGRLSGAGALSSG
jgi:hypothetical protein